MPVEDFKYFSIWKRAGWQQGFAEHIRVDGSECLTLSAGEESIITILVDAGVRRPESQEKCDGPVGICFDRRGNLYVAAAEIESYNKTKPETKTCYLYRRLRDKATFVRLPCIGGECGELPKQFRFAGGEPVEYCGRMAVHQSTLYVADTFNNRVQAFYLPTLQLRFILGEEENSNQAACDPVSVDLKLQQPKDMVTDSKGHLYVLDSGNKRILQFTRDGLFLRTINCQGEGHLSEPIALAVDREDILYVIDATNYAIVKFSQNGEWLENIDSCQRSDPQISQPSHIAVDHDKNIYLAEKVKACGTEAIVSTRVYQLDASGRQLGYSEIPGECLQIITDHKGALHGIWRQQKQPHRTNIQNRIIQFGGSDSFLSHGTYYSRVFDSCEPETTWHRLLIEANIPEHTKVEVFCFASETPRDRRAIEQDEWIPVLNSPHNGIETNDAPFDAAKGRYLLLRFDLSGDGRHSPAVKSARIFFPRDSYLRYLPAVYQENAISKELLERFLAIFESMSVTLEEEITDIPRYFDAGATEEKFVDWLGTWLAVFKDENWEAMKKREMLNKAFQLYKQRGTAIGLQGLIKLFTGSKDVRIIDHHSLRSPLIVRNNSAVGYGTRVGTKRRRRLVLEESSKIGEFVLLEDDDSPERAFELNAYDFTIFTDASLTEGQGHALWRLIREETPAHTRFNLRTGRKTAMQLGVHSALGVNTKLSKGFEPMRLGKTSRVGKETFLGTQYRLRGAIGSRARLAIDTILR